MSLGGHHLNRLRIGALSVVALAAIGASAGSASAARWTLRQLPPAQLEGSTSEPGLSGISCPSESLCVAVGGFDTLAFSQGPTGGAAKWHVVNPDYPVGPGKTCVEGEAHCPTPGGRLQAVSCASPSFCVAASYEGFVYVSTDPTGGADAWTPTVLNEGTGNTHLTAVSCPAPSFCAAVSGGYRASGKVLTSTDPISGRWEVTQLGSPLDLRGISLRHPDVLRRRRSRRANLRLDQPDGRQLGLACDRNPWWSRGPRRSRLRIDGALCHRQPDRQHSHLDQPGRRRGLERGQCRRLGADHRRLLPDHGPMRRGRQQRRRADLDQPDGRRRILALREPGSVHAHRRHRTTAVERAFRSLLRLDLALRPGRHQRPHLHFHPSLLGSQRTHRAIAAGPASDPARSSSSPSTSGRTPSPVTAESAPAFASTRRPGPGGSSASETAVVTGPVTHRCVTGRRAGGTCCACAPLARPACAVRRRSSISACWRHGSVSVAMPCDGCEER